MKKVLVLDDNPAILEHISNIVHEIDIKSEVYSYDNVKDAYQCALEKVIDLFIIDIILDTSRPGDSSGLNFVENIRKVNHYGLTPIIFVTSLEDAKLYTYEKLHCYSFIEKPFDVVRLKALVEQCLRYPGNNNIAKTLYFRKDGIIVAIERDDIVYAESSHHTLLIHTKKNDILSVPYVTVKSFFSDVDSSDFIQCSRNTVINKNFVRNVDIPNRIIQMKDNLGRVEIGVTYKKQMKEIFNRNV